MLLKANLGSDAGMLVSWDSAAEVYLYLKEVYSYQLEAYLELSEVYSNTNSNKQKGSSLLDRFFLQMCQLQHVQCIWFTRKVYSLLTSRLVSFIFKRNFHSSQLS